MVRKMYATQYKMHIKYIQKIAWRTTYCLFTLLDTFACVSLCVCLFGLQLLKQFTWNLHFWYDGIL